MAKNAAPKPQKAAKPDKGKKSTDKNGKPAAGIPSTGAQSVGAAKGAAGATSVPLSAMSPEQMTAAQLEQAIRESNDPNTKLKKLRSPVNLRSCLLNILILIVLTFGIVILWCWKAVDKFDFATIMGDMFDQFGISKFFSNLGKTVSGWFGG